jgi:hypothetical protein
LKNIQYILLLLSIGFSSCQDRYNIVVSGKITDEFGEPISNAEVVVLCWYMHGLDDASFRKETLTTDNEGRYLTTFYKGHQVDVASKAVGYQPSRRYNELRGNHVEINLKLSEIIGNPSLVSLLNTNINSFSGTDSVPLIKIRVYSDESNKTLDLNRIETYGFNLKTMSINKDTTQCDFWFKIERNLGQPRTVRANRNGGIIPIYVSDVNTTFLFEKGTAPTTGYVKEYRLNGKEEGLFVLCRDGMTFGKIVLEKSEIDSSVPDGKGGHYKEYIKQFSCLYQPDGSRNLSYSQPNIDLEEFLVDHRLQ